MVKVTKDFIHAGKTEKGGWTSAQLALLGVKWPPHKGWIAKVAASDLRLTEEQAIAFLSKPEG